MHTFLGNTISSYASERKVQDVVQIQRDSSHQSEVSPVVNGVRDKNGHEGKVRKDAYHWWKREIASFGSLGNCCKNVFLFILQHNYFHQTSKDFLSSTHMRYPGMILW